MFTLRSLWYIAKKYSSILNVDLTSVEIFDGSQSFTWKKSTYRDLLGRSTIFPSIFTVRPRARDSWVLQAPLASFNEREKR